MKDLLILIESENNEIVSDFCFSAYLGASQTKWLENNNYVIKKLL